MSVSQRISLREEPFLSRSWALHIGFFFRSFTFFFFFGALIKAISTSMLQNTWLPSVRPHVLRLLSPLFLVLRSRDPGSARSRHSSLPLAASGYNSLTRESFLGSFSIHVTKYEDQRGGQNLLRFWLFWKQSKFWQKLPTRDFSNLKAYLIHTFTVITVRPPTKTNHAAERFLEKKVRCFHHLGDWTPLPRGTEVWFSAKLHHYQDAPAHLGGLPINPTSWVPGPARVTLNSEGDLESLSIPILQEY